MKKHGFTLIELLIVIGIIGILISISVASYSSVQKKGRDARRHGDLKAIQNAWEQYYADNNANYPNDCSFSAAPTLGVMSATYLPNGIPVDPKSNAGTTVPYQSACTKAAYCFCANLEGETNSNKDCNNTMAAAPFLGIDCVKNLQ